MIRGAHDAWSGWVCVLLVGILSGIVAGVVDIGATWLTDIKLGICPSAFYLNKEQCCWSSNETVVDISGNCTLWQSWPELLDQGKFSSFWQVDTRDWLSPRKITQLYLGLLTRNLIFSHRQNRNQCERICHIILFLCHCRSDICRISCQLGSHVCSLRMWLRYPRNQNNSEWVHYQRVPWQMDISDQSCLNHVGCSSWLEPGKRRSNGPHGLLYREHLGLPFPQVRTERSKKERNTVSCKCCGSSHCFWGSHWRSNVFLGRSVILFSPQDVVALVFLCACSRFCAAIHQPIWQ